MLVCETSDDVALGDDPFDVLAVGRDDQCTDPAGCELNDCIADGCARSDRRYRGVLAGKEERDFMALPPVEDL